MMSWYALLLLREGNHKEADEQYDLGDDLAQCPAQRPAELEPRSPSLSVTTIPSTILPRVACLAELSMMAKYRICTTSITPLSIQSTAMIPPKSAVSGFASKSLILITPTPMRMNWITV